MQSYSSPQLQFRFISSEELSDDSYQSYHKFHCKVNPISQQTFNGGKVLLKCHFKTTITYPILLLLIRHHIIIRTSSNHPQFYVSYVHIKCLYVYDYKYKRIYIHDVVNKRDDPQWPLVSQILIGSHALLLCQIYCVCPCHIYCVRFLSSDHRTFS